MIKLSDYIAKRLKEVYNVNIFLLFLENMFSFLDIKKI